MTEAIIDAIRNRSAPEGLSGNDANVVGYAKELLIDHEISDDTFGDYLHCLRPSPRPNRIKRARPAISAVELDKIRKRRLVVLGVVRPLRCVPHLRGHSFRIFG